MTFRKRKSRFFAYHPRTYPKELIALWGPCYVWAPFAQNDTVNLGFRRSHLVEVFEAAGAQEHEGEEHEVVAGMDHGAGGERAGAEADCA
jgi:hypothetical protein